MKFFCTRPRLATALMAKGYAATVEPNPWEPERTSWSFEMTPELAESVKSYYDSIGKECPAAVLRYLGDI